MWLIPSFVVYVFYVKDVYERRHVESNIYSINRRIDHAFPKLSRLLVFLMFLKGPIELAFPCRAALRMLLYLPERRYLPSRPHHPLLDLFVPPVLCLFFQLFFGPGKVDKVSKGGAAILGVKNPALRGQLRMERHSAALRDFASANNGSIASVY